MVDSAAFESPHYASGQAHGILIHIDRSTAELAGNVEEKRQWHL
jgi:hypothetical protein